LKAFTNSFTQTAVARFGTWVAVVVGCDTTLPCLGGGGGRRREEEEKEGEEEGEEEGGYGGIVIHPHE